MIESLEQLRKIVDVCTRTEGGLETVWITKIGLLKDLEAVEREVEERYVELPKDADGEYIHIGDRVEDNERVARIVLTDGSWGPSIYIEKLPNVLHEHFCNEISHYHAPIVEDVLRAFADHAYNEAMKFERVSDETIAEYAAKLQLKEVE